jgi:hypothetical protein
VLRLALGNLAASNSATHTTDVAYRPADQILALNLAQQISSAQSQTWAQVATCTVCNVVTLQAAMRLFARQCHWCLLLFSSGSKQPH